MNSVRSRRKDSRHIAAGATGRLHSLKVFLRVWALHSAHVVRMQELLTEDVSDKTGNVFCSCYPPHADSYMFSDIIQDSVLQLWCPNSPSFFFSERKGATFPEATARRADEIRRMVR